MANFYYGCDDNENYWINLDHVSFGKSKPNRLILKLVDGTVVQIEGEDEIAVKQYLWEKSLNLEDAHISNKELIDADKRYNHEDSPPLSDDFFNNHDYVYDNSQSTDDDHLDIEPPTGIPI